MFPAPKHFTTFTERHIYGSSRLGVNNLEVELISPVTVSLTSTSRLLGRKNYEISNHLGNVLTVVSDVIIPEDNNTDGEVDGYYADVVSATDYSAFGVALYGRSWSGNDYRYGFQGQDKDDEISGNGNSYTAEFWQYSSRLGRRWNIDPVLKPWESTFSTFSNNPIIYIDPDGDTDYYNKRGKWIGTDGINNKETRIVLSKRTEKIIKAATKENQVISMNENVHRDIVSPMAPNEIKASDRAYRDSEKDGKEHGFAAGKTPSGESIIEEHLPGTSGSIKPLQAMNKIKAEGNTNTFDAHVHTKTFTQDGNVSVPYPSPDDGSGNGDIPVRAKAEAEYGYSKPSVILGYDITLQRNEIGKLSIKDAPKTIGFYDSKGTRATMNYNQFKRASSKITKDQQKRRSN